MEKAKPDAGESQKRPSPIKVNIGQVTWPCKSNPREDQLGTKLYTEQIPECVVANSNKSKQDMCDNDK